MSDAMNSRENRSNPHICHVVPETSSLADAFRKLVSRCLLIELPSSDWVVGYYNNPHNAQKKVLVFSLTSRSETRCFIVNEDMSYMEVVNGFRKDIVKVERLMSSSQLEDLLQKFNDAQSCPGWKSNPDQKSIDLIIRNNISRAYNCHGILDDGGRPLCTACTELEKQFPIFTDEPIPADIQQYQRKIVQRFRTRMRVYYCRKRQSQSTQPDENQVASKFVNISFKHENKMFTVLLEKIHQLPPELFRTVMAIMAGLGQTQSKKTEKKNPGPPFQDDPEINIDFQPPIEDRFLCQSATNDPLPGPSIDDNTMVLQIQQVLDDGRVEMRQVFVNNMNENLTMFEEEGCQLPRNLQNALTEILANAKDLPDTAFDIDTEALMDGSVPVDLGVALSNEDTRLPLEDMQLDMDDTDLETNTA